MKFRIFLTGSGIAEEALQLLNEENCVYQIGDANDTPDDLKRKLKKFNPDALIVRQGKISEEVQQSAVNLQVICKHGVGTDNIDIAAATRRQIPVMFTPGVNFESVAEHSLALMFALARRIPSQDHRIKHGTFDKRGYDGLELFGKTLGIVGFGHIGRRLAELVAPLRMKVLAYHPSCTDEVLPNYISKVKQVGEIYSQADIISFHCPLSPETKGMVNRNTLQQMKKNVYLINTARGGIIMGKDLLEALQAGRIAGAALDVFETEPPLEDDPLIQLENVIVTTHIAGISDNSFKNMGINSVNNVLSILKQRPIDWKSVLNPEVLKKEGYTESN